ncbi:MAG: hypothetical protein GF398_13330 [Chitinivibrionales bacterium]|nr:hypothetical protein [Chitinivibrionales bacterium]
MKNEVLEELWESKDKIAKENHYDVELLAKKLRENQKEKKHEGIDLSNREIYLT